MVVWGSATHHARTMEPIQSRGRRRFCPWCPPKTNRCTHHGKANGVVLMSGCEWHVHMWVRNPNEPRRRV